MKPEGWMVGERVQMHAATDAWMRGDRFGVVTAVGTRLVTVLMDKSGRTLRVVPENIGEWMGKWGKPS